MSHVVNSDVIFGEDSYTNRGDNAPRKSFPLLDLL